MDTGRSLGEYLRRRRLELGYSINEVARRLDDLGVRLSPTQLRRIESGLVPRADHLAGLCHVYGLSAALVTDLLLGYRAAELRFQDRGQDPGELLEEGVRLARSGRENRARIRFLVAELKAMAAGAEDQRCAALARLAWIDVRQGFWDAVVRRCLDVIEGPGALPRDRDVARCMLLRAFARRGWRELAAGFAPVVEGIARDRRRDAKLRGSAWAALAAHYRATRELVRAVDCARRAMRAYAKSDAALERLRVGLEIADALHDDGEVRAEIRELRRLERETGSSETAGSRLAVLWRLGRALVTAGERVDEAVAFLEEAENLAADLDREEELFRAKAWLLRALEVTGDGRRQAELQAWLRRHGPRYVADLAEAAELAGARGRKTAGPPGGPGVLPSDGPLPGPTGRAGRQVPGGEA